MKTCAFLGRRAAEREREAEKDWPNAINPSREKWIWGKQECKPSGGPQTGRSLSLLKNFYTYSSPPIFYTEFVSFSLSHAGLMVRKWKWEKIWYEEERNERKNEFKLHIVSLLFLMNPISRSISSMTTFSSPRAQRSFLRSEMMKRTRERKKNRAADFFILIRASRGEMKRERQTRRDEKRISFPA